MNRLAAKVNGLKTPKGKTRSKATKSGIERPVSVKINVSDERPSSEYPPFSDSSGIIPKKKIFLLESEQNLMKKEIEDLRLSLNSVNKNTPISKNVPLASSPISNASNNAKEIFWEVRILTYGALGYCTLLYDF